MFHISTVFIIFPIAGVIGGEYPLLTLLWTLLFVLAFYSILISQNRTVQWLAWWIMLAYIFYTSVWLNSGFTWFIFYLSNLLIYELDEISFHSWRFVSFIVLQPLILTGIYMVGQVSTEQLLFFVVTFVVSDAFTFGLYQHGCLGEPASQCSTDDGYWKYCLYCFSCPRWTLVPFEFLPRMAPIYWKTDSNLSTDAGCLYLFGAPRV